MAITIGGLRPVNPIVSDLMSSAVPGEDLFIARRALPRVDVDGAAFQGLLWVEDADPFIGQQHIDLRRSALSAYPELSSSDPTTVAYACEEHAGKRTIPHDLLRRSQFPEDLRDREALLVRRALLIEQEVDLAASIFAAGVWPGVGFPNTSVALVALPGGSGVQFGQALARELQDLNIALAIARDTANGIQPDSMIIGVGAFDALKVSTDIRNFGNVNMQRALVTDAVMLEILGSALGIDPARIFVGRARQRTNNPGQPLAAQNIWANNVLFYYSGEGAFSATRMAGGARVSPVTAACVAEDIAAGGADVAGYEWDSDDPPAKVVAGAQSYDQVMMDNSLGMLLTACA